jgi:hypothetical protein
MRRLKGLIAVLVIATVMAACEEGTRKKVAQANNDVARGISVLLVLDSELIDTGALSKDDAIALTSAILDLNKAFEEFNTQAQSYKTFDTNAKTNLLLTLNTISASVSRLNDQGVLHIKNPDSQVRFRAAIAVVQSGIAVLQVVLGGN